MKNILWLVNTELPQIAQVRGDPVKHTCGWIASAYPYIQSNYCLTVVYPVFQKEKAGEKLEGDVRYIAFYQNGADTCSKQQQALFRDILERCRPDVVDIWGTEFIRSYNMVMACRERGLLDRTVVSLQGSASEIGQHYASNLPGRIMRAKTLRDWLRRDSVRQQQRRYMERGYYEAEVLKAVSYCIGKTDWDQSLCRKFHPGVRYFRCNEILRDSFYAHKGAWKVENCQRHTILMCQGNYPLKGLHNVLQALRQLKEKYPDVKLVVTGTNPVPSGSWRSRIKTTAYGKYLRHLISEWKLEDQVVFTGMQNERQMVERYLQAHAVVVASSVENESNSVSEAKLLGTPVVSSDVGGVASRIDHGRDGYLFPYDEPHMLAHYLEKLFSDDQRCAAFSARGCVNVSKLVSKDENDAARQAIYEQIMSSGGKLREERI